MTADRQPGEFPPGLGLPEPEHPAWLMVNVFPDTTLGRQAWHLHQRELPRLLESSRGQWAAYRGDRFLGVGTSHLRLYEEWVGRGFSPEDLVICRIQPIEGEERFGMGVCWIAEGR
jgi:hypothetical protein